MADPEAVDDQSVIPVHCRPDEITVSESVCKAPCAVGEKYQGSKGNGNDQCGRQLFDIDLF